MTHKTETEMILVDVLEFTLQQQRNNCQTLEPNGGVHTATPF